MVRITYFFTMWNISREFFKVGFVCPFELCSLKGCQDLLKTQNMPLWGKNFLFKSCQSWLQLMFRWTAYLPNQRPQYAVLLKGLYHVPKLPSQLPNQAAAWWACLCLSNFLSHIILFLQWKSTYWHLSQLKCHISCEGFLDLPCH